MTKQLLERAIRSNDLNEQELRTVFTAMVSGQMSEAEIAGFLVAWRCGQENAELLAVGAKVLRERSILLEDPITRRPAFDNCGTGGSGQKKFNTSTTAAFIAAACGLNMAKHGNRSASGRCGSADLMEAIGFSLDLPVFRVTEIYNETGLTFLFAPTFHPVMKNVRDIRKSLGVRTVFNLLGPLANPFAPEGQLIGVPEKRLMRPMAEALIKLGVTTGLVVCARSGLDEISTEDVTDAYVIKHDKITPLLINPQDLGLAQAEVQMQVGDASESKELFMSVIKGEDSPHAAGAILNAAFLLWMSGKHGTPEEAALVVKKQLSQGMVFKFVNAWLEVARRRGG